MNDRKYIDIKTFIAPEDKHPSRYYHMVGGLSNRKVLNLESQMHNFVFEIQFEI